MYIPTFFQMNETVMLKLSRFMGSATLLLEAYLMICFTLSFVQFHLVTSNHSLH